MPVIAPVSPPPPHHPNFKLWTRCRISQNLVRTLCHQWNSELRNIPI